MFHNNSEHKQAVEGMGGRGSLPWKYKQRYLFTKYVHKQGNWILGRKFEA